MKLLRYGLPGREKPGVLDTNGQIRDLSRMVSDTIQEVLLPESLNPLKQVDLTALPCVEGQVRLGPCVGAVETFICIGLNYFDHAAETGASLPSEPVIFMKATSAISGPNDDVVIPPRSRKTDWKWNSE